MISISRKNDDDSVLILDVLFKKIAWECYPILRYK